MSDKPNQNRTRTGGLLAGALAAVGLSGKAQAQSNDSGFVDAASIEGVAKVEMLDDGGARLTLDNGEVIEVPADQVSIQSGQVLVDAAAVQSAASAAGFTVNPYIVAGAVGLAGVGIAVALDDDDDDSPPVPTPQDDVLMG
ncbi:MAG: hypothetical protein AAF829_05450, partial [Pseudomonadota bacterium]